MRDGIKTQETLNSPRNHVVMYWLYVIGFVSVLLVHGFSERGMLPVIQNPEITELVFLLLFSTGLFVLFILRDYQVSRLKKELEGKRKEASRLGKELSASYSYIGEVNRKFEILKDVSVEIPEILENGKKNGKDVYFDVLHAIQIFSGCRDFVVAFFASDDGEKNPMEIFLPSSQLTASPKHILLGEFVKDQSRFTKKSGEYCLVEANGTIGKMHCVAVFRRFSLRGDAVDLVRPLLMQALFLHVHAKTKKVSKKKS